MPNLPTGICKYCGKEFKQNKWADGRYSKSLYCCSEHANLYYKENITKQKEVAICKYCGKPFKQKMYPNGQYSKAAYCSNECSSLAYKEKHPNNRKAPKTKCKYCGKEFEQTLLPSGSFSGKIYCSDECYNKAQEKPEKYLKCKICGKIFKAPYSSLGRQYNVSYCSDECRKAANKHVETKRICKQCGKEYIQINEQGSREFCSKECKQIYDEQKKIGTCKNCGKVFDQTIKKDGSYSKRDFCCDTCRFDYYKKNSYRKCKACGKIFKIEHYDDGRVDERACCSKECEESGWQFKADYRISKCAYCGKEFKRYRKPKTGQFSGSIPLYCSDECQIKGRVKTCIENYGEDFYKRLSEAGGQANSKINHQFAELLKSNNINFEQEYNIDNYLYDFYIPDANKVIEINPSYTHTVAGNHFNGFQYNEKYETYHISKTVAAQRKNIECIHVWQWDKWNNIIDIIKPKQKLYARKLQLKETTKKEANEFISLYHLQGSCYGNSVNLGLYQGEELVQVMTFGKPRYNKNYQWELLRLCTKSDYLIVGGAEKLFKYFIRKYSPESIISYCDSSKFNGDVYLRLGFKFKETSKPQKVWSKNTEYVTDNLLRQQGYDRLFKTNYGKGTNNEQLMLENGWLPIFDCGQKVYIYNNQGESK